MKSKYFYKVVGHVVEGGKDHYYSLGFTTSKKAWFLNSNGWSFNDLIFIKQKVQPTAKQQYLNA